MNAHALGILEYPRLLDLVAGFAASAPGAARVRALVPSADLDWLEAEHRRVGAVRGLLGGDLPWHPEPVPELAEPLTRLRVAGIMWSAPELLAGAVLLRSARRTREALRDERRPAVLRAVLGAVRRADGRRARGRGGDRARDRRGRPRARRCVAGAAAHPARAARIARGADPHSRARDGRARVASPRARHVRHRARGTLRDPGAARRREAGRRHRARRVGHRRHAVRRAAGRDRVRQPHPRARERGAGRGRAHPARAHRSSFVRIATR